MNTEEREIPIAFGIFDMEDNLIGWRMDTFNTLGSTPKIYTYSENQVKIVLDNIQSSLEGKGSGFFKELMKYNGSMAGQALTHTEEQEQKLQELGTYRVKIYECPGYEKDEEGRKLAYPNLDMWKLTYASQEPIKTYKFTSKPSI